MKKADMDIKFLKHMLEVGAWSQVNYDNYFNNIKLVENKGEINVNTFSLFDSSDGSGDGTFIWWVIVTNYVPLCQLVLFPNPVKGILILTTKQRVVRGTAKF